MSFAAILFTGFALSMDAFAVAMTKGMVVNSLCKSLGLKIAMFFGLFQGGMPLLGWFLGIGFEQHIKSIDHWIALILLSYLGYRMIKSFIDERNASDKAEEIVLREDKISTKDIVLLAVATSIDALAVGISFAFLNINIIEVSMSIGIITFIMCFIGVNIGKKIGDQFNGYAELIGGIILIAIGLNIFNDHTQIFDRLF